MGWVRRIVTGVSVAAAVAGVAWASRPKPTEVDDDLEGGGVAHLDEGSPRGDHAPGGLEHAQHAAAHGGLQVDLLARRGRLRGPREERAGAGELVLGAAGGAPPGARGASRRRA